MSPPGEAGKIHIRCRKDTRQRIEAASRVKGGLQMRLTRKKFGVRLREMRRTKGIGLRELARIAKISPAFLSVIESGSAPPPSEKKLKALAKVLGIEGDELVALSGRIPAEIRRIIGKHPREYLDLLRATDELPIEKLRYLQNTGVWLSGAQQSRIQGLEALIAGIKVTDGTNRGP